MIFFFIDFVWRNCNYETKLRTDMHSETEWFNMTQNDLQYKTKWLTKDGMIYNKRRNDLQDETKLSKDGTTWVSRHSIQSPSVLDLDQGCVISGSLTRVTDKATVSSSLKRQRKKSLEICLINSMSNEITCSSTKIF